MVYCVKSGLIGLNVQQDGEPFVAARMAIEDQFDSPYPAQLLLLELVELSPILLTETSDDRYVGEPDAEGGRHALWLEKMIR